jgi:L-ribulose-5-phosphate 3-epimerase
MHRIGIMQGRLSPVKYGKIQTFPTDTWKEEFALAKKIGYELIEWVLDTTDLTRNPLLLAEGRKEINQIKKEYGIDIPAVCCDYFVEYPFHSEELGIRLQAQGMLVELIRVCPEVGIRFIELPLIGKSSIKRKEDAAPVINFFNDLVPMLEAQDMYLLLETDFSPENLKTLLEEIPSERIQINYDTGNSAYWGFDTEYELSNYGNRIGNIHIKDCTPKDYSVMLGKGDVNFELSFEWFKKLGYKGDFILQAVRGEDNFGLSKLFYQFTNSYIKKYFN